MMTKKSQLALTVLSLIGSLLISTTALAAGTSATKAAPHPMVTLKHKALQCSSCHVDLGKTGPKPGQRVTPPKKEACLACHSEESIVQAGAKFNFDAPFKDPKTGEKSVQHVEINPHDNFHFGRSDECVNCHKEHRPSVVTCETCHDIGPWGMKAPR